MSADILFLDTAYIYGLINIRDQWHQRSVEWSHKVISGKYLLLTTEFVLIEIANGLSSLQFRQDAADIIQVLQDNDHVKIIPATSGLFQNGLELFRSRNDKTWGLTDCISFVVMKENGVTDVLTTDKHFEQAGFRVLLFE